MLNVEQGENPAANHTYNGTQRAGGTADGISPKRLHNVDLVVLMERALNGAIWAHHDAGVKTIRIPTKLTGRPWVAYFEAVAKALDVNFDNHERNYQTMLKARKALAARQKLLRK